MALALGGSITDMPDALQPQDTGFYVACNASDKSIWVAFDFEPYGETGDIEEVRPEFGDPYGQLPGDKEELVIGVQKLFSGDWTAKKPLSLDHGDPFKDGAGKTVGGQAVCGTSDHKQCGHCYQGRRGEARSSI